MQHLHNATMGLNTDDINRRYRNDGSGVMITLCFKKIIHASAWSLLSQSWSSKMRLDLHACSNAVLDWLKGFDSDISRKSEEITEFQIDFRTAVTIPEVLEMFARVLHWQQVELEHLAVPVINRMQDGVDDDGEPIMVDVPGFAPIDPSYPFHSQLWFLQLSLRKTANSKDLGKIRTIIEKGIEAKKTIEEVQQDIHRYVAKYQPPDTNTIAQPVPVRAHSAQIDATTMDGTNNYPQSMQQQIEPYYHQHGDHGQYERMEGTTRAFVGTIHPATTGQVKQQYQQPSDEYQQDVRDDYQPDYRMDNVRANVSMGGQRRPSDQHQQGGAPPSQRARFNDHPQSKDRMPQPVCQYFQHGACTFGDRCQNRHVYEEGGGMTNVPMTFQQQQQWRLQQQDAEQRGQAAQQMLQQGSMGHMHPAGMYGRPPQPPGQPGRGPYGGRGGRGVGGRY
jgi:hypothetical protein